LSVVVDARFHRNFQSQKFLRQKILNAKKNPAQKFSNPEISGTKNFTVRKIPFAEIFGCEKGKNRKLQNEALF
jgi:hypothetical protein